MDNLGKLGWLASEVLLKDAGVKDKYNPAQVAVVLANANSSLDNDLKYVKTIADGASPSVFVYTLPNIVIGEICIRNNFKGEHAFFIQDEFDSQFIFKQVTYLLNHELASACICGWVDVLGDNYKAALYLIEHDQKHIELQSKENIFISSRLRDFDIFDELAIVCYHLGSNYYDEGCDAIDELVDRCLNSVNHVILKNEFDRIQKNAKLLGYNLTLNT